MANSVDEFRSRLAAGAITLSKFEDQNGLWAKDIMYVERVRVEFGDNVVFLTKAEYQSLTAAEKRSIHHSPSSPGYP